VRQALVSGGGSQHLRHWRATPRKGLESGHQESQNPEESIETVYLKDESMSTSGNYEKFFYAEGKMYSHIMDPRTGYPSQGMLSTSVIAPRTLDSEAWTKPYYILGPQWAAKHRHDDFRVYFCESETRCNMRLASMNSRFFGCLPPPAHRCTAGLVYAAGRTLHETIPGYPRQGQYPGNLQAARLSGAGNLATRRSFWMSTPPSFSPTCFSLSNRWG